MLLQGLIISQIRRGSLSTAYRLRNGNTRTQLGAIQFITAEFITTHRRHDTKPIVSIVTEIPIVTECATKTRKSIEGLRDVGVGSVTRHSFGSQFHRDAIRLQQSWEFGAEWVCSG